MNLNHLPTFEILIESFFSTYIFELIESLLIPFSHAWPKIHIQIFEFFLWTASSKIICWYEKYHSSNNHVIAA